MNRIPPTCVIKKYTLLAFSTLLLISACSTDPDTGEITKKISMANNEAENTAEDEQFLYETAEGNMKEIMLGQLAMRSGSIQEVKDLGEMMYNDHSKSLRELRTLAAQKNIELPKTTSDDLQDMYDELKSKSGSDFDKDYCDMMVEDHKKDIEKFETASNRSNDVDVRNWTRKTLPVLKKHLQHSKACKEACEKKENAM